MRKTILISLALVCLASTFALGQDFKTRKKLIEVGWASPDTRSLRLMSQEMEATAPFDGVVFTLKFEAEGQTFNENSVLSPTLWKRKWLSNQLADMKACHFKKFTDNFIRVNTAPGNLKWEDEQAWSAATSNLGHVAWFAKVSGSKGIAFDPECYAGAQYQWKPGSGSTFEVTRAFARKRGVQAMRAMAKEFPEIVFFSFWLLSLNTQNANSPDPFTSLRTEKYGLWPDFVAGMLRAAPTSVKFIDANENGYYPDDRNGYLSLYSMSKGDNSPLRNLLPNDLRAKYNRQTNVGFGFYLDRYLNRPDAKYYIAPLPGGTSLERLGINLNAALEISDEYVWAYGEQCRWWKKLGGAENTPDPSLKDTVGKGRLWDEAMPGISLTLNAARDPGIVLKYLAARRTLGMNQAINPTFDEEKPKTRENVLAMDWSAGAVPGFAQWQSEESKGKFIWDRSANVGKMEGVENGCYIQKFPVHPGEKLLVEVEGKGAGDRAFMARWQTSDGKWTNWDQDLTFGFKVQPDNKETARGIVTAPEKAGQLVLLLIVNNQSRNESCWFDNLGVYRVQDLIKIKSDSK